MAGTEFEDTSYCLEVMPVYCIREYSIDQIWEDTLSDKRHGKSVVDFSVFEIKHNVHCDMKDSEDLKLVSLDVARMSDAFHKI